MIACVKCPLNNCLSCNNQDCFECESGYFILEKNGEKSCDLCKEGIQNSKNISENILI